MIKNIKVTKIEVEKDISINPESISVSLKEIKKLVNEKNISYDDIAILYRTNAQSRKLEEALLKENIPYKLIGSYFFYNRKEIKDLIAYLNYHYL